MSYENIPQELKLLPNWLVWRAEPLANGKVDKIPLNARTGWGAAVTNQEHLSTFEQAVRATANEGVHGIGFAFTEGAGYGGIDFDDCHKASPEDWRRYEFIINTFDSYTEYSPSGNGLHTIIRASTPNGRRRNGVELYTSGRFFTFTGNVYGTLKPIAERQELAMQLYSEMGNGADANEHYIGDAAPKTWTEDVIKMAENASNGELFKALIRGEWSACGYPSQSEADQALMNIIVFYTKNRAQAAQIFRMSELGKRDKAQRYKYIEYTMDKAFDQTLPPLNFDNIVNQINDTIAANKIKQQPQPLSTPVTNNSIDLDMWRQERPPGLMGLMLDYFLARSPYPAYEISLAAALGLMAGICGRAYNVNDSGLNLYIMLLAETGSGKDAMSSGIKKLISEVSRQTIDGQEFNAAWTFLGPSNAASGPGLLKYIAKQDIPSFVSVTLEAGKRLQQMTDKNANSAEKSFAGAILALYTAGQHGNVHKGSTYSQEKDNIGDIKAPAFTWLGEGEPTGFYEALSEANITDGLVPRFIIIEYTGEAGEFNRNMNKAAPSQELLSGTTKLMLTSLATNQSQSVIVPTMTTEAEDKLFFYLDYCNKHRKVTKGTPIAHLWNRAHLNIWRVAALLSISFNHTAPHIGVKMVDWAASLVLSNTIKLVAKFDGGTIGGGDMQKAINKISKVVVSYITGNSSARNAQEMAYLNKGSISRSMLLRSVANTAVFKNDKNMLTNTIGELIKIGVLNSIASVQDRRREFGHASEVYQICDTQWFMDNVN